MRRHSSIESLSNVLEGKKNVNDVRGSHHNDAVLVARWG